MKAISTRQPWHYGTVRCPSDRRRQRHGREDQAVRRRSGEGLVDTGQLQRSPDARDRVGPRLHQASLRRQPLALWHCPMPKRSRRNVMAEKAVRPLTGLVDTGQRQRYARTPGRVTPTARHADACVGRLRGTTPTPGRCREPSMRSARSAPRARRRRSWSTCSRRCSTSATPSAS